jgi:bis(5'-nucleosyl)-tetraphosphatase (symmetrical)
MQTTASAAPPHSNTTPLAFGDIQGCREPFRRLLQELAPAPDTPLWFSGDLVNRGPQSLDTLRDIIAMDKRATVVLGNHDVNLLAVAAGLRRPKRGDTLDDILAAPDSADLLDWLRHRPFAHFADGMLMVHAGVLPQWDLALTMELAHELEQALRADNWKATLETLYGEGPLRWSNKLKRSERLKVTYNGLTRLRFCDQTGTMEFTGNGGLNSAPGGFGPWFDAPGRKTQSITVVFGHWAGLGLMLRDDAICLDSGCAWGNKLSAVRLAANPAERSVTQVDCCGAVKRGEHP